MMRLILLAAISMMQRCATMEEAAPAPTLAIAGQVAVVGDWEVGCDNLGVCTAITALPMQKGQLRAQRGALRIIYTASGEYYVYAMALDTHSAAPPQLLSDARAHAVLALLGQNDQAQLTIDDVDGQSIVVPGRGFPPIEAALQQWRHSFVMPISAEAPVMAVAQPVWDAMVPNLSAAQSGACGASSSAQPGEVWDVNGKYRILRYDCVPVRAINPISLWFTTSYTNTELVPLTHQLVDAPSTQFHNASFAAMQNVMTTTTQASGLFGCGTWEAYAVTTDGLILVERRIATLCRALPQGAWISVYAHPTLRLPSIY